MGKGRFFMQARKKGHGGLFCFEMAQYFYAQRQVGSLERHFHKFSPDSHGGYQLCIEGYQLRSPRLLIFCCVMLLGGYCSQFQRSLSADTDSDGFIFVSVPCFEKCIVAVY